MKVWVMLLFTVFVFAFLGFCFDYTLWSIAGKNVPWFADVIAGVVTNAVIVSATVVCWVMRLCGMEPPFIG